MRVSSYHQMIAAAAVRELGIDPAEIESIEVDGVEVSDLEAAEVELAANEFVNKNSLNDKLDSLCMRLTPKEKEALSEEDFATIRSMKTMPRTRKAAHDLVQRVKHSPTAEKLQALQAKFETTKVGSQVSDLVTKGDPERIHYSAQAQVKLKSGDVRPVSVEVDDRKHSIPLQRLAVLVSVSSIVPVPFMDKAVPAAMGLVMLLGSGAAKLGNNPQLSQALLKTAEKYGMLAVLNTIPGVGNVFVAQGVQRDIEDIKGLLHGGE